ncbi:MAG TPA: ABC transporter permease [Acidimicrobiales bacterium]
MTAALDLSTIPTTQVTPASAARDIAVVTRRNLRRLARTPQLLAFSTIQPVMFTLLFRYVFGGAIRTPGMPYVDYLMPGIFVQVVLFGGTTAVALATDLTSGMVDRFRSLPMARSAVLAGRTFADLARNVITLVILLVVGSLVGFRFHNGPVAGLAGVLLVLAFGYAFSWLSAVVGLTVKDPETAQIAGLLPVFPFIFASSAFVPVRSMPGWMQAFAKVQPVSVLVNSVRALTQGGPIYHSLWQAVAWIVVFLVFFVPLAVRRYRKL